MPYLVDADWIINAATKRYRADEILEQLAPAGIFVSLTTLAEVYEAGYNSPNPEAYIASYRWVFGQFQVAILTEAVMSQFAEVRALLRRQGRLIPDFDILLGVTAVYYDLTLLTFNIRHLDRIPDIRIYRHP